ncbi:MAG: DNA primase small subunit PriS [Thermoplasmata archaeon]|nr:DNA primase small subunit PriS [Thermoplasmata archaeon]
MGKTVALEAPALDWARGLFARYYRSQEIAPPGRFARREFAAFPFAAENLMRRHASFRTVDELRGFLRTEAPRHVYYSSAYYTHPDHPKMAGKEWLGADLIFDLDADHLRGAERLTYPEQLDRVKERVRDLMDDFLFGDFGVDRSATRLVFSGGRGYHVHVQEEAFLSLSSPERRELVEYVMGIGFDPATAVFEAREEASNPLALSGLDAGVDPGRPRRAGRTRPYKRLVPPDTPGWRGRTTRAVQRLLARWEDLGPDGAAKEMEALGLPKTSARHLAKTLIGEGRARTIRTTLSLEVFRGAVPQELLDLVLKQAAIEVQGETDAPVTTDIHRLIRLPNSLHGGSGLRVAPVAPDELDKFDPLRDALAPGLGSETVRVELREPVDYRLGATLIEGAAGDVKQLPNGAALFLVLRGEAALRP